MPKKLDNSDQAWKQVRIEQAQERSLHTWSRSRLRGLIDKMLGHFSTLSPRTESWLLAAFYLLLCLVSKSYWEMNTLSKRAVVLDQPEMIITLLCLFTGTMLLLLLKMNHSMRQSYAIGPTSVLQFLSRDPRIEKEIEECRCAMERLKNYGKPDWNEKQKEFKRTIAEFAEDIHDQQKRGGRILPLKPALLVYVFLLVSAFVMVDVALGFSDGGPLHPSSDLPHTFWDQTRFYLVANLDHLIHGNFKLETYGVIGDVILIAEVLVTVSLVLMLIPAFTTAADRFSHNCENKETIEKSLIVYFASKYPEHFGSV